MSRTEQSVENQEQRTLAQSIHVGALCRVEEFDSAKMTVKVQPLSKALDGGVYRSPPPILNVPVAIIRGGGLILRPWYKSGDLGVLLFCDHDIDRIMEAGAEVQPNTERNHAEEDAVFVGAFTPASNPVTGLPSEAIVMAAEGGAVYVAVSKDKITFKGPIEIIGDITHTGKSTVSDDVVASGKSLKSHTHTDSMGGTTSSPK
jgi:hypothetical protein